MIAPQTHRHRGAPLVSAWSAIPSAASQPSLNPMNPTATCPPSSIPSPESTPRLRPHRLFPRPAATMLEWPLLPLIASATR